MEHPDQRREFKRFARKLAVFQVPLLLAIVVQQLVLPMDYFNFRLWEALCVSHFTRYLPGRFYPNSEIRKIEEGDLGHGTHYSIKKDVLWITDNHGFRNRPAQTSHYPVVIVGDSNAVGCSLTQADTLGEVLASRLNLPVYTEAPVSLNYFLEDKRFVEDPPEVVVLECIERFMDVEPLAVRGIRSQFTDNPALLSAISGADRLCKMPILLYTRARLRDQISLLLNRILLNRQQTMPPMLGTPAIDDSMLFIERGESRPNPEAIAATLAGYKQELQRRNIHLIFLPVPEKSNIYYSKLGQQRSPETLRSLIQLLRKQDIDVIDLQTPFDRERDLTGELMFHPDDSHWTPRAVQIAVDALLPLLLRRLAEHRP